MLKWFVAIPNVIAEPVLFFVVAVSTVPLIAPLCVIAPVEVRFTTPPPLTAAFTPKAPEFANRSICPLVVVNGFVTVKLVPLDKYNAAVPVLIVAPGNVNNPLATTFNG